MAVTVNQFNKITREACDVLTPAELTQLEEAIQAKIHQATTGKAR